MKELRVRFIRLGVYHRAICSFFAKVITYSEYGNFFWYTFNYCKDVAALLPQYGIHVYTFALQNDSQRHNKFLDSGRCVLLTSFNIGPHSLEIERAQHKVHMPSHFSMHSCLRYYTVTAAYAAVQSRVNFDNSPQISFTVHI
jgi:hypothetical protein